MDASEVGQLVGDDGSLHIAEVTVSERVGTEGGVDSGSAILEFFKNVDGGEELAHEATRLILT